MSRATEIWDMLKDSSDDRIGWHCRRMLSGDSPPDLLAGIHKPENIPGLLLEVPASSIDRNTEYPISLGFELQPQPIGPGREGTVRLCLKLSEPQFEDVFAVLADDVSEAIAGTSNPKESVAGLLARLRVWQSFFRLQESGGLGRSEIIGLQGELVFLDALLDSAVSPVSAITAWSGPLHGLRDFEFSENAVEVKTTTRQPPDTFDVNELAQLDNAPLRNLYVAHVSLVESAEGGQTLDELVEVLERKIAAKDRGILPTWRDLLMHAGYNKEIQPKRQPSFRLISIGSYLVEGDFPRIIPGDVRAGIVGCRYRVQVAALEPFAIGFDRIISELS